MEVFRILTFNHHEAYLTALGATGHKFDVVTKYRQLDLKWQANQHPIPSNMSAICFDNDTIQKLKSGYYDFVICHTILNLLWLFLYRRPHYIFVAHIPLFFHSPSLFVKSILKKIVLKLFQMTHKLSFVADSDFKRRRWFEKGEVAILTPTTSPDPIEYDLGSQIEPKSETPVVTVGNQIKERGIELGYPYLKSILLDFPIRVLGNNPNIKQSIKPTSYQNYIELLYKASIYLYTIEQPYGDGYNTAMLEAMSIGMPVVTIYNPSSPIKHGYNGLVGKNTLELKQHLSRLINSPDEIKIMGQNARKTIESRFSNQSFINKWQDILNR